jgi:signal peptidase I
MPAMDETLTTAPSVEARAAAHPTDTDWLSSTQSLLATIVIAIFVITFVIQAFQIPTDSMENTLLIGDYLLVDKLHYGGKLGFPLVPYRPIKRGDIIVFHYPINPPQHFVKRVIGVPGDKIRLINRQVYVNGVPTTEPYVVHKIGDHNVFRDEFPRMNIPYGLDSRWWLQMQNLIEDGQLIVPSGHYFVMGDNRDDSYDSRYWGFVPQANVIGRPLIIYWSLRSLSDDMPQSPSVGDKIWHFAYAALHIFQITRWDRTFRIVR